MRLYYRIIPAILVANCAVIFEPARAQGVFTGTWEVTNAEVAPWVGKVPGPKPNFDDGLRHGRIVIEPEFFRTPAYSGIECEKPHYLIENMPLNMIFEGSLFNQETNFDATVEAAKHYDLPTETVQTLETACYDMQYHLNKRGELIFAFYNVIYTARRSK